ncbi:hypothetical protein KIPB_000144 [Kipferlia bialata]|uniref:Uncharacterized protein n=1 Tax=Kipferlia bialata TaxID=797122 RepID=A0A9K3CNC8_9EUKA|nr:hypothetical protein KIPB_000144 [Kipferlia bialata]|eukprot:g144.t1
MSKRQPWFTHCTSLPSVVPGIEIAVHATSAGKRISVAPLGCNEVMLTYTGHRGIQQWRILSLITDDNDGPSLRSIEIDGPPWGGGSTVDVQLYRVGGVVVAYGDHLLHSVTPRWCMWVCKVDVLFRGSDVESLGPYDTRRRDVMPWVEVKHVLKRTPQPRIMPVMCVDGDTLVLTGGISHPKMDTRRNKKRLRDGTWEWTLSDGWTKYQNRTPGTGFSGQIVSPDLGVSKHSNACHNIVSYCADSRRWSQETDMWSVYPETNAAYRTTCIIPIGRHHLQLTEPTHSSYGSDVSYWLRDTVSHDIVPLDPLPTDTLDPLITDDANMLGSAYALINPTTLIRVQADSTLVIELDPEVLGHEYHTSMAGCGDWAISCAHIHRKEKKQRHK